MGTWSKNVNASRQSCPVPKPVPSPMATLVATSFLIIAALEWSLSFTWTQQKLISVLEGVHGLLFFGPPRSLLGRELGATGLFVSKWHIATLIDSESAVMPPTQKLPKLQHKPRLFLAISFYGIPTVSHHHTFIIVHCTLCMFWRSQNSTSSTAQGGGGSFKNRKPIGEERLVVVNHGWQSEATDLSIDLSIYRSIYLSFFLSFYLSIYLSIYLILSI